MCGVLGIYGPSAERLKSRLPAALEIIQHRGPDGQGTFQSESKVCLLGHRRLSILDLSEGASQPMRRRKSVLSFNGEIYNHLELRKDLDFVFNTHSDTETLLAGLSLQGTAILEKCTGMYAGAYWDEEEGSLLLFRDGLGIKPLYYVTLSDSSVAFSSEIKGLLALVPDLPRKCESQVLETYLQYENYSNHQSLFQGVSLLPPGAFFRLKLDQGRVSKKAGRIPSPPLTSHLDLLEEIRVSVRQSVEQHLLSDVPLGVYLSGGIDSSLVAKLASDKIPNLLAFTGYFETQDGYYDERPIAKVLARSIHVPLHEVKIEPSHFRESLDKVVYALDEPRMGMGAFSQFQVAKEMAKHRKVVLAGHGGDELFGGYPLFIATWFLKKAFSREALARISRLRLKEWPWVAHVLLHYMRTKKIQFAPEIFNRSIENADFEMELSNSPLELLRRYYQNTYLPGLLVVEDKISMAHGLETRVPLWSQPLVSRFLSVPYETLIPQGELKGTFKKAVCDLLPPEVLTAPKRGFPTPLRLWFRNELLDFVRERLLTPVNPLHAFISKREIETLVYRHEKFPLPFALDERRAHRIWMLLCLESWFRQFKVT